MAVVAWLRRLEISLEVVDQLRDVPANSRLLRTLRSVCTMSRLRARPTQQWRIAFLGTRRSCKLGSS
jgi:hypothetical protein